MVGRLRDALALAASEADLLCVPVPDCCAVRLVDGLILEVGPLALPDTVATIACREILRDRGSEPSEAAVRAEVTRRGFRYSSPVVTPRTDATSRPL